MTFNTSVLAFAGSEAIVAGVSPAFGAATVKLIMLMMPVAKADSDKAHIKKQTAKMPYNRFCIVFFT